MKLAILGGAGRMGQMLLGCAQELGLEVVATTERPDSPFIGQTAGNGLSYQADWPGAADTVIDFTFHTCVTANLENAVRCRQAYVLGTTGLTEAERNTRFAVSAGYMPVTQEAFDRYLPKEIENLTEPKYQELYRAFQETQRSYQFYSAPQLESYLETETLFESQIRRCLRNEREKYLTSQEQTEALLAELSAQSYGLFQGLMQD